MRNASSAHLHSSATFRSAASVRWCSAIFCLSWAFTRPDGMDGFVNVRATMLDDHAWFVPFVETSRAEGFPWAVTGARSRATASDSPDCFNRLST